MLGDFARAEYLCRRAVESHPEIGEGWQLLAILCLNQDNITEAKQCSERALALLPDDAATLNTHASVLKALGNLEDAAKIFKHALEIMPDTAQILANLGDTVRLLGRAEEAVQLCRRAEYLAPDLAPAHNNLGAALLDTGEVREASQSFRRAIEIEPGDLDAHINLLRALARIGETAEAAKVLETIRRLSPLNSLAPIQRNAVASALIDIDELDEAEQLIRATLKEHPILAHGHNNLANILARRNDLDEATAEYIEALRLEPGNADYLANLGGAHQAGGHIADALGCFESALKINPNHADARWNRGIARLLSEDLEGGFTDYQWRWQLPEFTNRYDDFPEWTGDNPAGKTILIHSEQGFGDTIQFVRYAPILAERGARVILETHRPLVRLMETAEGIIQVIARGDPLPAFDFHAPLLSLPHLCETRLDTIPAHIPYLKNRPEGSINFGTDANVLVGIVWAGRPTHKNDRNRSCPLSLFLPLADIEGAALVSLQMGEAADELTAWPGNRPIPDLSPQLTDFSATATAISALDLVISVDTAVAHLAGALGKECWLMLPFAPDWRWMLERDDSPWYPSLRLFRQDRIGDWQSVTARIAEALGARAADTPPHNPRLFP